MLLPQKTEEKGKKFSKQVRALMVDVLEMPEQQFDELFIEAVFDERGWGQEGESEKKLMLPSLLLRARRGVAIKFGGRLPRNLEIDDISDRGRKSALNKWLNGEMVSSPGSPIPDNLLRQVRALMVEVLDIPASEVEAVIILFVFKNMGWSPSAQNSRGKLLLEARKAVAIQYGGGLPKRLYGREIPKRNGLAAWLEGYPVLIETKAPYKFYQEEVRALMVDALGMPEAEVDGLIKDALEEG